MRKTVNKQTLPWRVDLAVEKKHWSDIHTNSLARMDFSKHMSVEEERGLLVDISWKVKSKQDAKKIASIVHHYVKSNHIRCSISGWDMLSDDALSTIVNPMPRKGSM